MTKEKIICSKCGNLRQHHGKGVCNWCYRRYFWKQKLITCKRCGRQKPNQAFGYCAGCYNFVFHLESTKAHNQKKYHNINYETYKKITERCLICSFDKVVELHHLDKNHNNNSEKNMIGLCPNHHRMLHNFQFREEVLTQIQEALAEDKSPLPREETDALCNEPEALEIIEPEVLLDETPPSLAQPLQIMINQRNFS